VSTSTAVDLDVERYLKEIAPHLAALPLEERADLLEDLAQHLREIAAEPGPPLAERLGSPEAYAAELLASAGVAPTGRPRPPLLARAATLAGRARGTWIGQEVGRLEPVLRPAWWVVRAYLAVSLLSALERSGSFPGFPIPRLFGNEAAGLLAVLVAVPLSVRLGRRRLPPAGRLAVVGANVVLAFFALALLDRVGAPEVYYVTDPSGAPPPYNGGCLSNGSGQRITNLYAYDTEGRLLDPVLLYDQNGQPVDNLCPEYDDQGRRLSTEYRQDTNGAPVINAFPRRQSAWVQPQQPYDGARPPMTMQPDATIPVRPPAVVVPKLAPTTTVTTAAPPG
jgi:hypothetical protein